jgi:hypothetical protein
MWPNLSGCAPLGLVDCPEYPAVQSAELTPPPRWDQQPAPGQLRWPKRHVPLQGLRRRQPPQNDAPGRGGVCQAAAAAHPARAFRQDSPLRSAGQSRPPPPRRCCAPRARSIPSARCSRNPRACANATVPTLWSQRVGASTRAARPAPPPARCRSRQFMNPVSHPPLICSTPCPDGGATRLCTPRLGRGGRRLGARSDTKSPGPGSPATCSPGADARLGNGAGAVRRPNPRILSP